MSLLIEGAPTGGDLLAEQTRKVADVANGIGWMWRLPVWSDVLQTVGRPPARLACRH
jgi:hypothetical protein